MLLSRNGNILHVFNFFGFAGRFKPAALVDEPPMNSNFLRFNFIDMQMGYRQVEYFEITACLKSPTETLMMR
jgi:hypothetical protein